MASLSLSVRKGKGHLRHNNRDIIANNIDKDRMGLNVVYKAEPLADAYEKCFGEELRRYNADKKPCRQIPDYLEHIKQSKNGEKPFYEIVVQVGNMYDCGVGQPNHADAKKILDKYMQSFQNRNPNLYVFNAVLHMDEKTPHLHIDYIPLAKGYKNGLQVRNSLDKALKQQGVDGMANAFENSNARWQDMEKDALGEILREYGHDRKPDTGLKREHLSNDGFKATMQRTENEIAQMPDKVQYREPMFGKKDKVMVEKKDLVLLERKAKLSKVNENASKRVLDNATEKLERAEKVLARAEREQQEVERLKKQYQTLYNEQATLRERYDTLYRGYEDRGLKISRLEHEKQWEVAKRKDLEQNFDNAVEKATEPLQKELSAWKSVATEVIRSHSIVLKALTFVCDRLPETSVLRDVLESALKYAVRHSKKHEYVQLLDDKVELTEEVRALMTSNLEYKNGNQGVGVYSKDGTFIVKCSSEIRAEQLFPKAHFPSIDRGFDR